ncbi:MAG: hypothetical protein RLZZ444_3668 [Pseudomonadota bacterium]|jgi:hypothetical protein
MSARRQIIIGILNLLLFLGILIWLERMAGRVWICSCGTVKLWEGAVHSSGNSQQIADWYTPSHIIHGFLFYAIGWMTLRWRPVVYRFTLAAIIETAWEVLENSPIIIERYRAATVSYDYLGDSILNSSFDLIWMAVGFVLALRLPVWVTILLALTAEIATGIIIRDNLTLNVIMLIHPIDAIRVWQSGL